LIPGEYLLKNEPVLCNKDKQVFTVKVVNRGDRPVQIGSHFHFYEVNKKLIFDRSKAFGLHLNVPAGTAVRFEPGDEKEVELIAFSGEQKVYGLNNLTNSSVQKGDA
jgi:urease subunit beta